MRLTQGGTGKVLRYFLSDFVGLQNLIVFLLFFDMIRISKKLPALGKNKKFK
jgi:hypothetical protein